jgi:hypothetical protein
MGVPSFIWNVKDLSNAEMRSSMIWRGCRAEDSERGLTGDSAAGWFASEPLHGVALAPQRLGLPTLGLLDDLPHGSESTAPGPGPIP